MTERGCREYAEVMRRRYQEAMGQHPTGQELAKLPRYELGQAGPVGPVGSGVQELIQVIPDDPVEHARFRAARLVASPGTVHAPA